MAVKPSGKPPGSTFGKRKVKHTEKRPYPPLKITMFRAPTETPRDARKESDSSDESDSDSDYSSSSSSSSSQSESMEIDEDSVATAKPIGKPTELKLAKTTRSIYKSAEITFPDGRKRVVTFGSAVLVRFFDGEEDNEIVTTCYGLVREIWSVRRNNRSVKSLGKECTEEEIEESETGVLFNISWLLDLDELKKNWGYELPYDIPQNERFYDPRSVDTIIAANITTAETVWFLDRRRNMSNRPAIPPESSNQLFVKNIVGDEARKGKTSKIVAYNMTDLDFDEKHEEHIQRVRTLLAPKEKDLLAVSVVGNDKNLSVDTATQKSKAKEKTAKAKKAQLEKQASEKRRRDAEQEALAHEQSKAKSAKTNAKAPGKKQLSTKSAKRCSSTFIEGNTDDEVDTLKDELAELYRTCDAATRRAEEAETRAEKLESLLARSDATQATAVAAAKSAAQAAAKQSQQSTPRKVTSQGAVSQSAMVTVDRLTEVIGSCNIAGLKDPVNAKAAAFADTNLLPAANKLIETATELEKEIFSRYPRDEPFGQGACIKEFVDVVRGDGPAFAVRLLLGELDASTLEVLRGSMKRGTGRAGGKSHEPQSTMSDSEDLDSSDEEDPAEVDETPCLVCGRTQGAASFVLCDSCPKGDHYGSLGLPSIPEGDWFCAGCEGNGKAEKFKAKKNKISKSKSAGGDDKYTDRTDLTVTQKTNLRMDLNGKWGPSAEQVDALEALFLTHVTSGQTSIISAKRREEIACDLAKLGPAHETKVKNWFMNRKTTWDKKKKKEALTLGISHQETQSEPESDDDDPIADLAPIVDV